MIAWGILNKLRTTYGNPHKTDRMHKYNMRFLKIIFILILYKTVLVFVYEHVWNTQPLSGD